MFPGSRRTVGHGRGGSIPALLALCILVVTSTAWARPAQGAIVSGVVGATVLDSSTNLSFVAAAGYRFNSAFGLGIELAFVPTLEPEQPFGIPLPVYGSINYSEPEGQATVFTTNLRLEMPTTSRRVAPYAVAGGGVANIKESFEITYSIVRPLLGYSELSFGQPTSPELIAPFPFPIPRPQPVSYSSVAMALTLGGGVSVLAGDHLSIDVDLRYLRLLGDTDRNVGRFGAGASYRF